jgi:hypothetical protein
MPYPIGFKELTTQQHIPGLTAVIFRWKCCVVFFNLKLNVRPCNGERSQTMKLERDDNTIVRAGTPNLPKLPQQSFVTAGDSTFTGPCQTYVRGPHVP